MYTNRHNYIMPLDQQTEMPSATKGRHEGNSLCSQEVTTIKCLFPVCISVPTTHILFFTTLILPIMPILGHPGSMLIQFNNF